MPHDGHNPFPILEGDHDAVPEVVGRDRWVEETYGDRAWVHPGAPGGSGFVGLAATSRRLLLFFGLLIAGVLVLFGRVTYLVAHGDTYRALSEGNRLRVLTAPAARGVIYDRNGTQLADNVPDLELAVIPADLSEDPTERSVELGQIAAATGGDAAAYAALLEEFGPHSYEPVTLAENITRDQAVQLTIIGADVRGVRIMSAAHRQYAASNALTTLSHILGYTGKVSKKDLERLGSGYRPTDATGKSGLELSYERALRGVPGESRVEVDALGNEVRTVSKQDPVAGDDLRLALDAEFTAAAQRALAHELGASGRKRGAVVVEDVTNGDVLALVSLPAYNDNRFAQGISRDEYAALADDPNQPLFPRAVSGSYPSGSTVKLVVAAAALAEGIVTPSTTVLSTGGIWYTKRYWFPDWKAGGHGYTNVVKAIAESVNTFFYMVGGGTDDFPGLGVDRLVKYFGAFGMGKDLGIDLPNENAGNLPTPSWKQQTKGEDWYIGDTYHLAIGQGDLLVTPLQVAAWTVAVANGGTLWRPHMVHELVGADGSVVRTMTPDAIATHVAPDEDLAVVRQGMRAAVTGGSAKDLWGTIVPVAGKTGTAQWNTGKANHAWFTGFAPFQDPKIAVTVLIEEGGEGSSVSVPVAREIFDWWALHRQSSTAP
jgi:penicillin-binding protein 2